MAKVCNRAQQTTSGLGPSATSRIDPERSCDLCNAPMGRNLQSQAGPCFDLHQHTGQVEGIELIHCPCGLRRRASNPGCFEKNHGSCVPPLRGVFASKPPLEVAQRARLRSSGQSTGHTSGSNSAPSFGSTCPDHAQTPIGEDNAHSTHHCNRSIDIEFDCFGSHYGAVGASDCVARHGHWVARKNRPSSMAQRELRA